MMMTEAKILSPFEFEEPLVEKVVRKRGKLEPRKKKPTKPQMTNLFCPEGK